MEGYFPLLRAPEFEPYYQMDFTIIIMIPLWFGVLAFYREYHQYILSPTDMALKKNRDGEIKEICYVLTFWPGQKCHSRWCTGRKWHILLAVMRGNRVGGNLLMKWVEVKISHDTLIDWRTGREWPLNCMTVISAWWRLNIRFQRSSGWSCRRWTII